MVATAPGTSFSGDTLERFALYRRFGDARCFFEVRPSARGIPDVTRVVQQIRSGFDLIDIDTMVLVSSMFVLWSPISGPATVPVMQPITGLPRVFATSSEHVTFRLENSPSWMSVDTKTAEIAGTPPVQAEYSFDIVASGHSPGMEERRLPAVVQAADLRMTWYGPFDMRSSYTANGQNSTALTVTNPSGNFLELSLALPTSRGQGAYVDEDSRRLLVSRRISLSRAVVTATVYQYGALRSLDQEFLLLPANFLHTRRSIVAPHSTFDVEQPDPAMHPTEAVDDEGRVVQRLHATSLSGLRGPVEVDTDPGWTAVVCAREIGQSANACIAHATGLFDIGETLTEEATAASRVKATASSSETGFGPEGVLTHQGAWMSRSGEPLPAWLEIDLGYERSVSGILLQPLAGGDPRTIPCGVTVWADDEPVLETELFRRDPADTVSTLWPMAFQARDLGWPAVHARRIRVVIDSCVSDPVISTGLKSVRVVTRPVAASLSLAEAVASVQGVESVDVDVHAGSTYIDAVDARAWYVHAVSMSATAGLTSLASSADSATRWDNVDVATGIQTVADLRVGYRPGSQVAFHADISHLFLHAFAMDSKSMFSTCQALVHGVLPAYDDETHGSCDWSTVETLDTSSAGIGRPPIDVAGRLMVHGPASVDLEPRDLELSLLAVQEQSGTGDVPVLPLVLGASAWSPADDMLARWGAGDGGSLASVLQCTIPAGGEYSGLEIPVGWTLVAIRDMGVRWAPDPNRDVRSLYGPDGTLVHRISILAPSDDHPIEFYIDSESPEAAFCSLASDGTLVASVRTCHVGQARVFATVRRGSVANTITRTIPLLGTETGAIISGGDGSVPVVLSVTEDGGSTSPAFHVDDESAAFYHASFAQASDRLAGSITSALSSEGLAIVVRMRRGSNASDDEHVAWLASETGPSVALLAKSAGGVVAWARDGLGADVHVQASDVHTPDGEWAVLTVLLSSTNLRVLDDRIQYAASAHSLDLSAFAEHAFILSVGNTPSPQFTIPSGLPVSTTQTFSGDVSHVRLYATQLEDTGVRDSTRAFPLAWLTGSERDDTAKGEEATVRLYASVGDRFETVSGPGEWLITTSITVFPQISELSSDGVTGRVRWEDDALGEGRKVFDLVASGACDRVFNDATMRVFRCSDATSDSEGFSMFLSTLGEAADMAELDLTAGASVDPYVAVSQTWYMYHGGAGAEPAREVVVADAKLPPGLSLDTDTGVLSGTPIVSAPARFAIVAVSRSGLRETREFSWNIATRPVWAENAGTLSPVAIDRAWTEDLSALYADPDSYRIVTGAPPDGTGLSVSGGQVAGTPTVLGQYAFTLLVASGTSSVITQTLPVAIEVRQLPGWITPDRLDDVAREEVYAVTLQTETGTEYRLQAGSSAPPGIALSLDGHLSGPPSEAGTFEFVVEATDPEVRHATEAQRITQLVAVRPRITTTSLLKVTKDRSFSQTVYATDAADWSAEWLNGSSPGGVEFTIEAGLGKVHSTPQSTGVYTLRVTAFSATSRVITDIVDYVIEVVEPPAWNTAPDLDHVAKNETYAIVLSADHTTSFSVVSGILPDGLILATDGSLTGTPTVQGTFVFTVRAESDKSMNAITDRSFTQLVATRPSWVTTSPLPNLTRDRAAEFTVEANDARWYANSSWSPYSILGLVWDDFAFLGTITGTPGRSGVFSSEFTAYSTTSNAIFVKRTFQVTVYDPPAWTSDSSIHAAHMEHVQFDLVATTATEYKVVDGALPAGITLGEASGLLSGSPSSESVATFTVRAKSYVSMNAETDETVTFTTSIRPEWMLANAVRSVTRARTCDIPMVAFASARYSVVAGSSPAGTTIPNGTPTQAILWEQKFGGDYTNYSGGDMRDWFRGRSTTYAGSAVDSISKGNEGSYYSYRWMGVVSPRSDSTVVFETESDDASHVFLNGTRIVDNGGGHGMRVRTSSQTTMLAGARYQLDILYGQGNGGAGMLFRYRYAPLGQVPGSTNVTSLSTLFDDGITPTYLSAAIEGTPSSTGSSSFTLRAFSRLSDEVYADQAFTVETLAEPVWRTSGALVDVAKGESYSVTLAADNVDSYTVVSGSLPAGLALNRGTGAITGTPSSQATYTFDVRAESSLSQNATADRTFTQLVATRPVWVTTSPLPSLTKDRSADFTVSATNTQKYATGPWSPANVGGMDWSEFATKGRLFGTPGRTDTYTITFTAYSTTSDDISADRTFTMVVYDPPSWSTSSGLEDVAKGEAYDLTFVAVPADTYARTAGTIPAGLSLASGGRMTGAPTTQTTFSFTIRATSNTAQNRWDDRQFTQLVATRPDWSGAPYSTNPQMPQITKGRACTLDNAYAQYAKADSYRVVDGDLPVGMSMSSTGLITGTPTRSEYRQWRTRADSMTSSTIFADRVFGVTSIDPPSWNTVASLADVALGEGYSVQFSAARADRYAQQSGTLPAGFGLSSAGLLSGTPSTQATYTFTLRATDNSAQNCHDDRSFTQIVARRPVWSSPYGTNPPLPNISKGRSFSLTNAYASYAASSSYRVIDGSIPPGVSVNTNGSMSGSATSTGTWQWRTEVWSTTSTAIKSSYVFRVTAIDIPSWNTAQGALPDVASNETYSVQFSATSADSYVRQSGTLPSGLSLTTGGRLQGTPNTVATYSFSIRATDASAQNCYEDRSFTQLVAQRPVWNSPYDLNTPLQNITVGRTFDINMAYANFVQDRGYRLDSGSTPPGTWVTWDGTLGGTSATETGTWQWTVRAMSVQSNAIQAFQDFKISVVDPPAWSTGSPLDRGVVGNWYRLDLSAQTADLFQVVSGSLPAGIELVSWGRLRGSPSGSSVDTFTVRATRTDTQDCWSDREFLLEFVDKPAWSTDSTLGRAVGGSWYSVYLSASTADLYEVVAGTLPPNMQLTSNGQLRGTSSGNAFYTFTVRATRTDTSGCFSDREFTVEVASAPVFTNPIPATINVNALRFVDGSGGNLNTDITSYEKSRSLIDGVYLYNSGRTIGGAPAKDASGQTITVSYASLSHSDLISTYTITVNTSHEEWNNLLYSQYKYASVTNGLGPYLSTSQSNIFEQPGNLVCTLRAAPSGNKQRMWFQRVWQNGVWGVRLAGHWESGGERFEFIPHVGLNSWEETRDARLLLERSNNGIWLHILTYRNGGYISVWNLYIGQVSAQPAYLRYQGYSLELVEPDGTVKAIWKGHITAL